jgi:hypothetical protein
MTMMLVQPPKLSGNYGASSTQVVFSFQFGSQHADPAHDVHFCFLIRTAEKCGKRNIKYVRQGEHGTKRRKPVAALVSRELRAISGTHKKRHLLLAQTCEFATSPNVIG